MNTETTETTAETAPLTLAEYLALPESERYDVDYRQAPALYNEWCEKHGVTLDIRHVQKPDADMITYRVEIKRASDHARGFWFDYSTGLGWVELYKSGIGWHPSSNVLYCLKTGTFTWANKIPVLQWGRTVEHPYRARIKKPTAADILNCLRSDASVRNCRDFEDFADEYGYDRDSRKAEETYRACLENTRGVENAVGSAAFAELLLLPGL